jgi:hypothetical protein
MGQLEPADLAKQGALGRLVAKAALTSSRVT